MSFTLDHSVAETDCQPLQTCIPKTRAPKAGIFTSRDYYLPSSCAITATGVILIGVSNGLLIAPAHADEIDLTVGYRPPGGEAQPASAWDDLPQPRLDHRDWTDEDDATWCATDGLEGAAGEDGCWIGEAEVEWEAIAASPADWMVDDEAVLREDGLEWLLTGPVPQGDEFWVSSSTTSLLEPANQTSALPPAVKPSDTEPSDTEPSDTEPSDTEPSDIALPEAEPPAAEPLAAEPSDTELSDTELSDMALPEAEPLAAPSDMALSGIELPGIGQSAGQVWAAASGGGAALHGADPIADGTALPWITAATDTALDGDGAIAPLWTLFATEPFQPEYPLAHGWGWNTATWEENPQAEDARLALDWDSDAALDLDSSLPPVWDETHWDDPDLLTQEHLAWLIPSRSRPLEGDRFDPYGASLLIEQGEQRRQASPSLDDWERVVAIASIDIPDLGTQPFPDLVPPAAATDSVVLPLTEGAIANLADGAADFAVATTASLPLEWVAQHPAEQLSLSHRADPLLLSQAAEPEAETIPVILDGEDAGTTADPEEDTFYNPEIQTQAAYLLEGEDSSARGRVTITQIINPYLIAGATIDLTGGNAFSDSREEGLNLNELYVTASLPDYPNLRFTVGLLDLTSYFDRNSFAKDSVTHFFNAVFQTNPALSAAGIASRPGLLVRFDPTDFLSFRAATFSSTRDLGDFELDGFAGEIAVRSGTAILRATYATAEDEGEDDGFREIFQFDRGGGNFGLRPGDREAAFGLNGEVFIPDLNMGLFARFGQYNNLDLDEGGSTFSFGFNLLDLFMQDDRLGLGYGRQLSNSDIRRDNGDPVPDVLELFYDIRVTRNLRFGVMVQQRDGFSETVAGLRIRADFDNSDFGRIF